jgi:hypothetical protein
MVIYSWIVLENVLNLGVGTLPVLDRLSQISKLFMFLTKNKGLQKSFTSLFLMALKFCLISFLPHPVAYST